MKQQIGNCAPEACIVALGVEDVEIFKKNVGVLLEEEEESGDLIIRCMRMSLWMQCSVGSRCRVERPNIDLSGDGLDAAGENEGLFHLSYAFPHQSEKG